MWDSNGVARRIMNPASSPATSTPLSPHNTTAPKPPPKVLIVGDVGTGKSTLVRYIQRLTAPGGDPAGGGKPQGRGDPKEALSSTIGFNCECVCISGGNANDSSVSLPGGRTLKPIIFVEVGGNRSFRPECRAPAYCLGDIAAVLFVFKDDQPDSIIPLKYWCDELQQYDLIQWSPTNEFSPHNNTPYSPSSSDKVYPKLMVVKIQHTPEEGGYSSPRGFLMGAGAYNAAPTTTDISVLSSSLQLFRQARSTVRDRIPPQVLEVITSALLLLRAAVSVYRRVLLIIMSVALFGPNQKVVPFSAPTADSTLNHIIGGKGASQTHVCTANLEAFADSCGELMEFFTFL